jgi:serine/threonine protein kinase
MCEANFDPEHLQNLNIQKPEVRCVLGDFSSAYNDFTRRNLYVRGPSRSEQTDEYAPPEALFGNTYNHTTSTLTTSFDSWSIGIVALELLLGTPNVFSVDQRTRYVRITGIVQHKKISLSHTLSHCDVLGLFFRTRCARKEQHQKKSTRRCT